MKNRKPDLHPAPRAATSPGVWVGVALAALIALFWAYAPTMNTGFLFDDAKQRFAMTAAKDPLSEWIGPVRPVLMLTYFINTRISPADTGSYHLFNVLIHALCGLLIFFVIRRILALAALPAKSHTPLALFGALLFLFHPLQTESVAYISGRSDALCGLFGAAAFAAFLYRKSPAISWGSVIVVVLLFAAAVLTKEQAVILPALFLLTDLWWNPQSPLAAVRANWKLYAVLAVGAGAGLALFWSLILGIGTGNSAGFALKDFTWYQYLFTQFRVLVTYPINFVFPANLNADWDFPISHTILEHGALFYLVFLLACAALALRYRRGFALSGYGFFVFLVLLVPTSSILPIQDPIAERRMYFPILGLILIAIDLLRRLKMEPKALAALAGAIVLVAAFATHARAEVWSDSVKLWQDVAEKSPRKFRPHFQLAFAYYELGQYQRAVEEFEKTAAIQKPTPDMLVDWGLAYDGLNQPDKALEKFRQAAAMEPSAHAWTQIGYIYAKQSRWKEAMDAFDAAEKVDANFPAIWMYRGQVALATNQPAAAIQLFQRALELDSGQAPARDGMQQAQRLLAAPGARR
ncbi:MAG: tetratricopeptide repeat protein [Candidatus Solibacter sp.]